MTLILAAIPCNTLIWNLYLLHPRRRVGHSYTAFLALATPYNTLFWDHATPLWDFLVSLRSSGGTTLYPFLATTLYPFSATTLYPFSATTLYPFFLRPRRTLFSCAEQLERRLPLATPSEHHPPAGSLPSGVSAAPTPQGFRIGGGTLRGRSGGRPESRHGDDHPGGVEVHQVRAVEDRSIYPRGSISSFLFLSFFFCLKSLARSEFFFMSNGRCAKF